MKAVVCRVDMTKGHQQRDLIIRMYQSGASSIREGGTSGVRPAFLIGAGVALLVFLGVFAYMARGVGQLPGEMSATLWLQSWRAPWLDDVMRAISAPGFQPLGLSLVALICGGVYLVGLRRESGLILTATLLSLAVGGIIKEVVARPRPADDLVQTFGQLGGFSFPSSHVISYMVFLGVIVFVSTRRMKRAAIRRLLIGGLVLTLVAVGVSRMYLGSHWLGDVVGGYVIGGVVLAASIALWRQWTGRATGEAPTEQV